ncbi:hypothetical protein KCH_01180 [Kitasatospora cheerisanensis KCTC 2395]|uniref:Chemotaxis protein n=1 Tax=Kitasatospora cheerisanensis KCTC 2395 TaxID=1348663 RepID=A0A066ZCJ4_9ACTN|nr:hypothetical protein KCH_01180 [Kitasatospora cheerisanensis KCTC 2395]
MGHSGAESGFARPRTEGRTAFGKGLHVPRPQPRRPRRAAPAAPVPGGVDPDAHPPPRAGQRPGPGPAAQPAGRGEGEGPGRPPGLPGRPDRRAGATRPGPHRGRPGARRGRAGDPRRAGRAPGLVTRPYRPRPGGPLRHLPDPQPGRRADRRTPALGARHRRRPGRAVGRHPGTGDRGDRLRLPADPRVRESRPGTPGADRRHPQHVPRRGDQDLPAAGRHRTRQGARRRPPPAVRGRRRPALALLDSVGAIAKEAAAQLPHGGLAQANAETVRQVVEPAVRAHADQEISNALAQLDKARGRSAFAAGLDEVWKSAGEGRVALLVVEENFRTTVRDDGDHLVPADADETGAREDIVDEVIERALDTGAKVSFVPDGTLSDAGRIAADLRY